MTGINRVEQSSFDKFINKVIEDNNKEVDILKKKNSDYANNKDVFSNFKSVSVILDLVFQGEKIKMTPEVVTIMLICVKLIRLGNLISKEGIPMNESIDDTMSDMVNYMRLLRGMIEER